MNTVTTQEVTALTAVQRAATALESSAIEQQLTELAESTKDIVVVTNKDGREQCHRAYMVAREKRVSVEKLGKAARDDANAFSKAVVAEESRLVAIIEPEELRLKALRDNWDTKEAEEKAAKKAAEEARVAGIKAKIQRFEKLVMDAAVKQFAADVKEILASVEAIEIDDSFEEFVGEAREARGKAKQTLTFIIEAKERAEQVAHEVAEQNRKMEAQLEELRRQNEALAKSQSPNADTPVDTQMPTEATVAEPVVPFIGHAPKAENAEQPAQAKEAEGPAQAPAWLPDAEKEIAKFLNGREWPKGKANEYRAVLVEYEKSKHAA